MQTKQILLGITDHQTLLHWIFITKNMNMQQSKNKYLTDVYSRIFLVGEGTKVL